MTNEVIVAVHKFASVTVTVYVPDDKLEGSSFVEPLDHVYVYGSVPDDTVIFTAPLVPPLHVTFVIEETKRLGPEISDTVADFVLVQPLRSVTETVYVAWSRPTIVPLVEPVDQL